jgi:MFS family permease
MPRTTMDEKAVDIETFHTSSEPHEAKLDIPPVTWWKDPGLRHLYMLMPILFLGSTINGYDGSLLNGLQTMEQWRSYFGYPSGAQLGLFTAIQNVGAVCALPFSSYLADLFGRRIGVEVCEQRIQSNLAVHVRTLSCPLSGSMSSTDFEVRLRAHVMPGMMC